MDDPAADEPDDELPVEVLGVVLEVEPDVVLLVLVFELVVLVAALATSAPPATRPPVSAAVASTLRMRNFMRVHLAFMIGTHHTTVVCTVTMRGRTVGASITA